MDFKKMWKRFFTLDRHHAEGFTLVELIVVIAILAILGGVAVPAYSGYVQKANMGADIALIGEIEHALTLAYYNQDLIEGSAGFIMLSPNAGESMADSEDGPTAHAMEKVFGSNWQDTMQLKYDNWGVKNMMVSYDDASAVVNSNFVQKYSPDELMAQVQAMTDAVNGLALEVGDIKVELVNMFNYGEGETAGNAIDDVIEEYGINKTWDQLTTEEKSNVLVLATASTISNGNGSFVEKVIPNYALYTAYAAENSTFNEAYKKFQNDIASVDPESADSQFEQIKAAYNELESAAGSDFSTWKESYGAEHTKAFNAVMAGVGNAMKDNGESILSNLGNANMFTTGIGNELYKDYLDTAYATAGGNKEYLDIIFDGLSTDFRGSVLVQYVVTNRELIIANTLPVA